MHTPGWNRLRKRLQKSAILLILGVLILIRVVDYYTTKIQVLQQQRDDQQLALNASEVELKRVDSEVKKNTNKVKKLSDMVATQSTQIQNFIVKNESIKDELLIYVLSQIIQAYIKKEEPIPTYIRSAMYYERVYSKKYPKYREAYSWKTTLKILYIEAGFTLDPKIGPRTELGCPQIREYEEERDRSGKIIKTPQLYNLLCSLGYRQSSYNGTIGLYRTNAEVQVHCFEEWFTMKLKDCNGELVPSIVAYNSRVSLPLESLYWFKYLRVSHLVDNWIDQAQQEVSKF